MTDELTTVTAKHIANELSKLEGEHRLPASAIREDESRCYGSKENLQGQINDLERRIAALEANQ